MYPTMYHRDEIFFRLGIEKSEDLLQKIRQAPNPDFQDDNGTSYLHRACQSHYYEAVKLLLELGADPNINDNRGYSPILEAIGRIDVNNNAILELMLQYGLNPDKIEGNKTLKETIEEFKDSEMNRLIKEYYQK